MTRAQALFSQVMGLDSDERQEFMQLMENTFELTEVPDESSNDMFTPERMAEMYRRAAEFAAGTSVVYDRATVSRRMDEALRKCES